MFASIRRLTQHSIVYGLGHMLARSLGFLLIPLHTNVLASEVYGVASLLFSSIAVMITVYGFGIDSAFLRYYIIEKHVAERRRIFSTAFWSIFASAACFSLVELLAARPLAAVLFESADYAHLVRLSAGVLFFDVLSILPLLLLRAEERSLLFITQRFANVALNLALNYVFLVKLGRGLAGIFEANLISSILSFAMLLPISLRQLRPFFDRVLLGRLLRFGLPYLPSTLAVVTIDQLDRLLLKIMTDFTTVGIYSAGYRLGSFMSLMVTAFRFAWVPFFLQQAAQEEDARPVFARVLTYFMFVCAAIFLATCLFIDDVIRLPLGSTTLFGKEFWGGTVIVPIVLLAYWLYGIGQNFYVGITLKEKTGYFPLITGAGALVNILANVLLIPPFGMIGAAWATVAAYAVMTVISYRVSQPLYPIQYEHARLFKIVLVTVAIYALHHFFTLGIFLRAGLLLLFPVLLYALGFFEKQEGQALKRLWARRLSNPAEKNKNIAEQEINP